MKRLKQLRRRLELTGYSNYRTYFEDLYLLAKDEFNKYSYLKFAEDLNLGSSNIVFTIIKGTRKLMFKHVRNVSDALEFDAGERRFFASLVRLQNSPSIGERLQDYDALLDVAGHRQNQDGSRDAILFFSAWHHVLVFESLELHPEGASPQQLLKEFRVPISTSDVRESLELLTHMGLIEERDGNYFKKEKNLSTGARVPGYGVIRFHLKMLELARESLSPEFSPDERNVSSVTLAVSDAGAQKIRATLEEFRKKIFAIASEDSSPKKLMQVNFQAFPLMNKDGKPGSEN
jgi:uncharacterized protein (TIGR02147 family)